MSDTKPQINKNFIAIYGNIDLDNDTEDQLIYASQLYGTFFAVSAKLKLNNNKDKLDSMELHLINYKGILNIGMLDSTKNTWYFDAASGCATLTLNLAACAGVHGTDKSLVLDCKEEELTKLKHFHVFRELNSFVPKNMKMTDHINSDYFDTEFYERDGALVRKRFRLDDAEIEGKSSEDDGKNDLLVSPTGKCETTFSHFIKR